MFYDRKIKYFDYIEQGQRQRNCGFIKLEVRDSVCNITMQIMGLYGTLNSNYKVYLLSVDRQETLCEIQLCRGKGDKVLRLQRDNLCAGIPYSQMEAIRIPISPTGELLCNIAEKVREKKVVVEDISEIEKDIVENTGETEDTVPETFEKIDEVTAAEAVEETNLKMQEAKKVPLLEDKWKQLVAIYPHIAPFQDDREYLSIGPGDFVIMPHKYYKLVNNSFLLHGFYNYKHLILTRVEKRGELQYYIGVPGNFYEREKQVALMFGFESFECREEPARSGDFGYYMIRVEI